MTRDDQIRATVAAGMQDSGVIREAITDAIRAAFREGDESSFITNIAHHVAESSMGVTQACRESHAIRLLNALESRVHVELTEKADNDLPQPDDEENDDE